MGRFAPSPTGDLHTGSLIAALASAIDAHANQGVWRLRIDDIDPAREQPDAAAGFTPTLARFGLRPDGPALYQSLNLSRYQKALVALGEAGLLYPCRCSRRELAGSPVYPGHCRPASGAARRAVALADLPVSLNACGIQSDTDTRMDAGASAVAWRLFLTGDAGFDDRVQGPQHSRLEHDHGDPVVWRRDHLPAYHLACAIDDAAPGISRVVRGADLLASTTVQIAIQARLGLGSPQYAHVPVAVDNTGCKLSKQTHAPALKPEQALTSLARVWRFLGQSPLPTAQTPQDFVQQAARAWQMAHVPPATSRPWPHP